MPFATVRSTLLALIGSLGLVILALASVHLSEILAKHDRSQLQSDANIARSQVARAALALARERDATFLSLAIGADVRTVTAVETDRSFAATHTTVSAGGRFVDAEVGAGFTAVHKETLPQLRAAAAAGMELPVGSPARNEAALQWFEGTSEAVKEIRSIRLRLLSADVPGEGLFNLYHLRTLTLILLDEMMKNAALLEVDIARQRDARSQSTAANADLPSITATGTPVSAGPFEEYLASLAEGQLGAGSGSFDAYVYNSAEMELRRALQSGVEVEQAILRWRRVSSASILQLDELQAATFRILQSRVATMQSQARADMLTWGLVVAASMVIVALAIWVVLGWVVGPLERMRTAMLELANDNLDIALPRPSRIKEIGAMDDALRVFKSNASRRRALQRERLKLHGRLEETYTHLKADLQAAAAIQASLLPQQAQMGGVSLSSYFRPSHFLAGDTFDVLQQPDGRVLVFQIDVAGHGAAAALVSVASKYTVAQAILQRPPESGLAELVEEINREWPSELPFFTLLLAEINPKTNEGELVQAGHPSPILLRSNGDLVVLGDGGLPIGALAQATYEAVPFSFQPNDRLVIATDGVHEMENDSGEPFSEDRLQALLQDSAAKSAEQIIAELDMSMRAWRGNETLDDDVTIIVLEGKRLHEVH